MEGSGYMAGDIKKIMDTIIEGRAKGNPVIERLTKAKLAMKGFIYEKYTATSEDDPEEIGNLHNIAKELNIMV